MTEKEKLALELQRRMQVVNAANTAMFPEIGTITGSVGLKLSSVNNTIPKGEYLVSRILTFDSSQPFTTTEITGEHDHKVPLPKKLSPLKSGARVLVIWCGYEPVVVSVLENS